MAQRLGAKVIDRLARDLRLSFPDMQGFSSRNLLFMRRFAEEFSDAAVVKQLASQLPCGHVMTVAEIEAELGGEAVDN